MKNIFALSLLAIAACNSEQTASQPAPPITSEAGLPPLASPTRTVGHRNPFGDVLQSDNLMVDGDFEITGRSDQAPWVVFNETQQTLNYDTGGRCRSGIRCAVIGLNDELIGYMASPALGDFSISIYVQPSTGRCSDAEIISYDIETQTSSNEIHSLTASPDVDGWCHFMGSAENLAYDQPTILVELAASANKAATLHVDQATVLPITEVPVHGIAPPVTTPPADVLARAKVAADWLSTHRKFGRNVPRSAP